MITREQAEQAFRERYTFPDPSRNPEIRYLEMNEVDQQQMVLYDEPLGIFEAMDRVWHCTFEIRYKELDQGQLTGRWQEWRKDECYIVEPKHGVYVVD